MSPVALFWIEIGVYLLAIPVLYWAMGKYSPAWRWLWVYLGIMTAGVIALRVV